MSLAAVMFVVAGSSVATFVNPSLLVGATTWIFEFLSIVKTYISYGISHFHLAGSICQIWMWFEELNMNFVMPKINLLRYQRMEL